MPIESINPATGQLIERFDPIEPDEYAAPSAAAPIDGRGRGLLIGIELKPSAGGARRFCEAL